MRRAIFSAPKYDGCGVYFISCEKEPGRFYVGSAKDLYTRESLHFSRLRRGAGPKKLQAAFDKWGPGAFQFVLHKLCDESEMWKAEQDLMDAVGAATIGYNSSPKSGPARGYKWSKESIAKRTASVLGRKMHPNTRAAIDRCRKERRNEISMKISEGLTRSWASRKLKHKQ